MTTLDIVIQAKKEAEEKVFELTGQRIEFMVIKESDTNSLVALYEDFKNKFNLNNDRTNIIVSYKRAFVVYAKTKLFYKDINIARAMKLDHVTILHHCKTDKNWTESGDEFYLRIKSEVFDYLMRK